MLTDEALGTIQAPALVLWTTKDPSGPVDEAKRIASLIPNARLVVFEKSGHSPQIEERELWLQVVREFLREALSGAGTI